ncbi:hypothetical protein GCM10011587_02850 [Pyruvatibacter mobilis]|nr:hypothetical protein GCM10011587_02850 [Pyruvatibacter mobilis]
MGENVLRLNRAGCVDSICYASFGQCAVVLFISRPNKSYMNVLVSHGESGCEFLYGLARLAVSNNNNEEIRIGELELGTKVRFMGTDRKAVIKALVLKVS